MKRVWLVIPVVLLAGCSAAPPATAPAADRIDCASGSITAQGSSAQANAVNSWIRNYQVACADATIEYDSVGSGTGVQRFVAGTGDFAGTDSPLSADDQAKADARCRTAPAVHLPMVVGPIALAYNVAGVGGLRLRPATIAKIFSAAATAWNDPAIVADNPNIVLPATPIRAAHRSDSSGTTDNFTAFLTKTAGWTFGGGRTWPIPGGSAAAGSDGVSAFVAQTDGAIGYVEWSYAQFHSLNTALIGNRADEFVALTGDAAGRTVASARTTGSDLRLSIDYATAEAGAYPLVLVTYEVVCRKGATGLVKSFLAYAASPAAQEAATRLGYAPLPESLRTKVTAAIAALGQ
jgi:phosphate transport system substrate-binding protein